MAGCIPLNQIRNASNSVYEYPEDESYISQGAYEHYRPPSGGHFATYRPIGDVSSIECKVDIATGEFHVTLTRKNILDIAYLPRAADILSWKEGDSSAGFVTPRHIWLRRVSNEARATSQTSITKGSGGVAQSPWKASDYKEVIEDESEAASPHSTLQQDVPNTEIAAKETAADSLAAVATAIVSAVTVACSEAAA